MRAKYLVQMNENAHPPGTPGFVTRQTEEREKRGVEGSGEKIESLKAIRSSGLG